VPADFKLAFPEFATVADAALLVNFDAATMLLNNSCGSRVCDAVLREKLLNWLTAHITALRNGVNGQPPSGLVGRIDSATEGSVSVSAVLADATLDQAWYTQTQYGLFYWNATAAYRTFVYVPAPAVCADYPNGMPFGVFPGEPGCGC
jgi:hypothetical protein